MEEKIESREQLIHSLGELLQMSNEEMSPIVDLTSQTIDMQVKSEYADLDEDEDEGWCPDMKSWTSTL